jgi:hypothetical protein
VPILGHIFNLSLSQLYIPTAWKQMAIVPVLKKAPLPLLAIKVPYPSLNFFPNYLNVLS